MKNLSADDRRAVRRAMEFKKQRGEAGTTTGTTMAKIIAGDEAEMYGRGYNKNFRVRAVVIEGGRVVGFFKGGK
jgi:hypothetical protein